MVQLLKFMPSDVAKVCGVLDDVPLEATAELCEEIKTSIFNCVAQAKQAWAHFNAQRDRQLEALKEQAQASGGQPPASDPQSSDGPSAPEFKIGDEVIGHATKEKDKWDKRGGVVVVVFTGHYKVKMKEGPAKDPLRKYLHVNVSRLEANSGEEDGPTETEGPAAATGATAAASTEAGWTNSDTEVRLYQMQ